MTEIVSPFSDEVTLFDLKYPHFPVQFVYTGAESYTELRVTDFVNTDVTATHVFDQHDAPLLRELAQALMTWADHIEGEDA